MAKSTEAEISKRVATVAQMLITGHNRQDILQFVAKEWNMSVRMTDVYIAKANALISELHSDDVDYYRKLILARQEDLYNRNYKIQDYRECRQVLQDVAKLIGANAPDKQEHSGDLNLIMPKFVMDEASDSEKSD